MKANNLLRLFLGACAATLLGACSQDNPKEVGTPDPEEVQFSTNIVTSYLRVTEGKWDANDAIGVYMTNKEGAISDALPPANVKYIAQTTDNKTSDFIAADEAQKLFWKYEHATEGADFIAYYPYSETIGSDYTLALDVADQSNLAAIDYLYASRTNVKKNTKVALVFKHTMPLLSFEFKTTTGETIEASKISALKLSGLKVRGKLSLADGSITSEGSAGDIPLNGTNVIIVPQEFTSGVSVTFSYNGMTYTWDLGSRKFESGRHYTLTAKLKDGSSEAGSIGGTVDDRDEEEIIDGGELDPDGGSTPSPEEPQTLSTNEDSKEITADGGDFEFTITTDASGITATSDVAWAKVPSGEISVPASGETVLQVTVEANDTESDRTAKITVTHNGTLRNASEGAVPIVITIIQKGKGSVTPTPSNEEGILISAYAEGGSNEKYLKISNRSSENIDLSGYEIWQYNNGKTSAEGKFIRSMEGILNAGEALIIYNKQAKKQDFSPIRSIEDNTFITNFNGDDAVAIVKGGEVVDLFGVIGNAKDNKVWEDQVYFRKSSIKSPSKTFNEDEWEKEEFKTKDAEAEPTTLFTKAFISEN